MLFTYTAVRTVHSLLHVTTLIKYIRGDISELYATITLIYAPSSVHLRYQLISFHLNAKVIHFSVFILFAEDQ